MDIELLNKAYQKLISKPINIINTDFKEFDEEFIYCNLGSVITFCGTLNQALFLNFIRNFSRQNKKCIYFIEKFEQEYLLKTLIKLNSSFHNNNILQAKKEIEKWDLYLFNNKFDNINDFCKIIKAQKPDYIFISDLTKFKIKNIDIDNVVLYLKNIVNEYHSSMFIQSGEIMLEDFNMDLLSDTIKDNSDIIIHSEIDVNKICRFWFLKNITLNNRIFSLKYDNEKFKFNEIDIKIERME